MSAGHLPLAREVERRLRFADLRRQRARAVLQLAACPSGDATTCGRSHRCATHRFLDVAAARPRLRLDALVTDVPAPVSGDCAGLDVALDDGEAHVWVALFSLGPEV